MVSSNTSGAMVSTLKSWARGATGSGKQATACWMIILLLLAPSQAKSQEPIHRQAQADAQVIDATDDIIILPEPIGDPLEPINRGLWELNRGLMIGVVQPTAKAYRFVVRKPLRTGIRNFGRNLGYPRRLINNSLQGKWIGSRDETYRFFCNTVVGVGGLFDVATRWGIPEWEADFGQTFGLWGWRPQVYLMLPIAGPSNERDALGGVLDGLANPLTYFPPYSYIPYGITYNNLSETVDEYVRVNRTTLDPYSVLRYSWTLRRLNAHRDVDLSVDGPQDPASLETLQSVFFTFKNPKFPHYGDTFRVNSPATGKQVPYTLWLQPGQAPLVYIVPGLGSHRLSAQTLALAELIYKEGFSVVTVSSAFNFEFINSGSSVAMPGYTPVDAQDMHQALSAIHQELTRNHPKRISSQTLMGFSMGGFHTLYLAGTARTNNPSLVQFDRYVAIDPPVRLTHAISQLDDFFRAALDWPAAERTQRIEDTFHKVAAVTKKLSSMTPDSPVPFSATESKFIIGLAFRMSLRDVIYLSQQRIDQGILKQPVNNWKREPVYREILQYSFADYLEKFVGPYYQGRRFELRSPEQLERATQLHSYEAGLRASEKVRVIANANDILLGAEDVEWMRNTFEPEQLTIFPRGGHMGNLSHPQVQRSIIDTIADLRPKPAQAKAD